jgi:hypothetical protein
MESPQKKIENYPPNITRHFSTIEVAIFSLRIMMDEYWESGSFPQGDIASGPPSNLALLTIKLAAKRSWRRSFQQENKM